MKIVEPEKILSNEKTFNEYMTEIKSAYDYLSKTPAWGGDVNYMKFNQNSFLSNKFVDFFKISKKTKSSEYEKVMKEAAEKEFKDVMGVDFTSYKSAISKLPDVKKGISNAITEINFGDIKKDPEALKASRDALSEAISGMDITEVGKFSNFVSKKRALENLQKMRPDNQSKNTLTVS